MACVMLTSYMYMRFLKYITCACNVVGMGGFKVAYNWKVVGMAVPEVVYGYEVIGMGCSRVEYARNPLVIGNVGIWICPKPACSLR